jgi:RNA polymerase sigma-70 factor (ECF subfamily)
VHSGLAVADERELSTERPTPAAGVDPFSLLAGRELDRAYRLAGLMLGNATDAEDVVSTAIEHAWTRRGQLRSPEAFRAWFDRILVNACRDLLRRRSRVRVVSLDPLPERAARDDPFRELLDRDEVSRALTGLAPDQRIVVILHYWAGLSLDAIAARVGARPGTVRSRLNRALTVLRASDELSQEPGAGR